MLVKGRVHPAGPVDMVDFLTSQVQQGCRKSWPGEVAAALSVIEEVGQVSGDDQIACNRLWLSCLKSCQMDLQQGSTRKKVALPLPLAVIISLELYLKDDAKPVHWRLIAWSCLLACWACFRADDIQGTDISRFTLTDQGLKGFLISTKTTGLHRLRSLPPRKAGKIR